LRQRLCRFAATVLIVLFGVGVTASPAMADGPSASSKHSLTKLSAASLKVLRGSGSAGVRAQQSGSGPDSFFGSTKGKVAIGLMIAGAAFTVWSINHDRKPVKSPIR
jgi:hypothetical protein